MTQPTQAQIEAAELAKWIKQLKWKSVDEDNMEFEVSATCYVKDALDKWAALTAAAQVEEPVVTGKSGYEYVSSYQEIVTHTIERCAQVAEGIRNCDYQSMLKIAAAIRKLKDEA